MPVVQDGALVGRLLLGVIVAVGVVGGLQVRVDLGDLERMERFALSRLWRLLVVEGARAARLRIVGRAVAVVVAAVHAGGQEVGGELAEPGRKLGEIRDDVHLASGETRDDGFGARRARGLVVGPREATARTRRGDVNAGLLARRVLPGAEHAPNASRRPLWHVSPTSTQALPTETPDAHVPVTGLPPEAYAATMARASGACGASSSIHTRQGPPALTPVLSQRSAALKNVWGRQVSPFSESDPAVAAGASSHEASRWTQSAA